MRRNTNGTLVAPPVPGGPVAQRASGAVARIRRLSDPAVPIVVPYAPGGSTDTIARIVGQQVGRSSYSTSQW